MLVQHAAVGVCCELLGFNRSSQDLDGEGCDEHSETALGPGGARRVAVAGAAGGGAA